jgi:hypothetical protein
MNENELHAVKRISANAPALPIKVHRFFVLIINKPRKACSIRSHYALAIELAFIADI